jgi:hypothetical protein
MILLTMLFCSSASAEDMSRVRLFVDGQEINMTAQPQIIDGVLMIPAEDVITQLGAEVEYDTSSNTVYIETEEQMRYLQQLAELMDKDPGVVNLINDVLSNYLAGSSSSGFDDSTNDNLLNNEPGNTSETDLQKPESCKPEPEPDQQSPDNSKTDPALQSPDNNTTDPGQQNLESSALKDNDQLTESNTSLNTRPFFKKLFSYLYG